MPRPRPRPVGQAVSRRRAAPVLAVLALLAVAAAATHLVVARQGPEAAAVLQHLLAMLGMAEPLGGPDGFVVGTIRLPRLLCALAGGASLGLAGAVMQAVFRNPLASPDVVGTAAGSALGGATAIVLGWAAASVLAVPLLSMAGAVLVTTLVFGLAGGGMRFSVTALLLAGIAMNTFTGALTSFVVTFRFDNYTASSSVLFWLMGGLDARTWDHVAITGGGMVVFALLLLPFVRDLDVLTLQDETVHSLGVDATRTRRLLLLFACGLTATTVANTGGIAFIGLVVPHMARLLVGPVHRVLLPASALLGALLLVLADFACRMAPPDANLRLGVITSAIGAPYFLYLLARHRRGESLR